MPRKQPIACLLVGEVDHSELRPAVSWLAEHVQLTSIATPAAAIAAAPNCPAFDLIICAQARPSQISADEIESLHRVWPLAKLVGLLGGWCEGEGRSGRPWSGVWRVAACNFARRMRQLIDVKRINAGDTRHIVAVIAPRDEARVANEVCEMTIVPNPAVNLASSFVTRSDDGHDHARSRAWLFPRLISDAERFYYAAAEPLTVGTGTVRIAATNRDSFEPLSDAARQAGFTATWQPRQDRQVNVEVTAAIWDATRSSLAEWRLIEAFARSLLPAPLIVLLGFPRSDDFQRAKTLSTVLSGKPDRITVLAKPLLLADLFGELFRMTCTIHTRHVLDTASSDHKDSQVNTLVTEYY